MNSSTYSIGGFITGALAFVAIFIYALSQWGLLFGLLFGWIPALIGAVIAGFIWPLIAAILAIIFLPYILFGHF